MAIIKLVKRPCTCSRRPGTKEINDLGCWYGTVWQCDECKAEWMMAEDPRDGGFYWRKLEGKGSAT